MVRKFGPFDTSSFYEVENRRLQRALAIAGPRATGFTFAGTGAVTAGTGAQLVIAAYPDGALIDGMYVENPATETVTLTTNIGSTNPRIDRLVMRLDMTAKTMAPFQIVGTPAASPSAPPLVNTGAIVDMPLCRYTMPGSGSAQNPASIVDERRTLSVGTGIEFVTNTSRVIPPNTPGLTAFDLADIVGGDPDGFSQTGDANHIKIPTGLGGMYGIGWGGSLSTIPPNRHYWDLEITGARTLTRRANAFGEDTVSSYTEVRLSAGDIVRFTVSASGSANYTVDNRFLSCWLKGA